MNRSISLWQFSGFAIVSLLGTLLHYLYDWTGENLLAATVSGVNESTFEHMKLLFFPLLLFAFIQSFFFKDFENFFCIKLYGTLLGIILIPVLFYTLNGAFGKTPDYINIAIFFVSAAAVFLFEDHLFKSGKVRCFAPRLAAFLLILIGVFFVVFTFFPPMLPLFKDPLTNTYGIIK